MTLIPVEEDKKTIAYRFRKAHSFVFLNEDEIIIQENPHKTSKSPEFFEYFKTLNVDTLYIKDIGHKTLLTLFNLDVKVFLIKESKTWSHIKPNALFLLNKENAKNHCSLGHQSKESH